MNAVEKNKWKKFFRFSVMAILALFFIFLFFHGFSLRALESAITYGAIMSLFDFFWIFCARDVNG
jgi:hypothetical protein